MEMVEILRQIDSLKKEAEALHPVKPEFETAFWNKFRIDFDYNSNHIEGNTLTYGHTQLLLLFDKVGGDYSLRELEEMKAHDVAMKLVKEAALDPDHILTEKFIKEINELILVRPFYKEAITPDGQPTRRQIEPGKYKKYPNSVRLENGEIFNYTSPEDTAAEMGDLIDWYRNEIESRELHPVQIAALFHYRFVRIHPFDDSNGRTSRLMMNYILIKNGFAPAVIDSVDKKKYLTALNRADTGDIEAFVHYITSIALKWQDLYTKALKGEKIEEEEDLDKELEILKRKLSKNKGPSLAISEDSVKRILDESVVPLVDAIGKKLTQFQELFNRVNFYVECPNLSQNVDSLHSLKGIVSSAYDKLKSGGELKIDFTHIGFNKGGINIFNIYSSVKIYFSTFKYQMKINDKNEIIIEKLYDENLDKVEIEHTAKEIAKLELETLKRLTNN